MFFPTHVRTLAAAMVLVSAAFCTPGRGDTRQLYKTLSEQAAPALVTIKCVLKFQGPSGAQENEREFTAVMIDAQGLVLCSSLQLGTSRLYRSMGTFTPTDIKVLIGDDTEGVEARLLTSDPELDLSWVQIKSPDPKGYKFLNLTGAEKPQVGDRILAAQRMDKYFDRILVVNEGNLGGITRKPRELYVPTTALEFSRTSVGMPIFNEAAAVIGIAVLQSPDPEDEGTRSASAEVLILPVSEVARATEKARTAKVEEEEEEDEESDGAAPAKQPADGKKSGADEEDEE